MTVSWGTLEKDQDAWELAKQKLGVVDVRDLSSSQFHGLITLAQKIKEGHVNVEKL